MSRIFAPHRHGARTIRPPATNSTDVNDESQRTRIGYEGRFMKRVSRLLMGSKIRQCHGWSGAREKGTPKYAGTPLSAESPMLTT